MTLPKIAKPLKEAGPHTGTPVRRVEGRAKVTGSAKYAAEFNTDGLVYGYIVNSAISKGRILKVDASRALALPGVLHVFTHENRPMTTFFDKRWKDEVAPIGRPFHPLENAEIKFGLQPIGLVVAETFQLARYAARLVRFTYETAEPDNDMQANLDQAKPARAGGSFKPPPKPKGEPDLILAAAQVKIEAEYYQPTEHHNPMEMFGSTVIYGEDDTLTIYDKTQGVLNSQQYVCGVFGLAPTKVRVFNPYMGGGFGAGLRPQHQLYMATMAAMQLKRSVRVEMTRSQMFSHGHRPCTIQRVALAADEHGKLAAMKHKTIAETSRFEDYAEIVVNWSGQNYPCDHVKLEHELVPIDNYTPLPMRAPGAVTGSWAIESAMDELSYAAGRDPMEMRLINYAEVDGNTGQPFSSKALKEALAQGADKFGWSKRSPQPRSMRDGKLLVGYGMAVGVWDAQQGMASAKATLSIDGKLVVGSATADIGTGTYTAMSIIAADALGLPLDDVTFRLGDSSLPQSPIEGGSWTVSSVGSAVKLACDQIGAKLIKLAQKAPGSPLANAQAADLEFIGGRIRLKADPSKSLSITDAMRSGEVLNIEETVKSMPNYLKQKGHTMSTHNAVFVEVKVDEAVGSVMVSRVVNAVAAGRIINAKAAASQVSGATVWGISMALHEETLNDTTLGRFMNHDLAEYHMAVNGDIHDIDVILVDEKDDIVNPLGAKGIGEIGICGVAAAVANAVYHATGKRVRSLPITPDKLL